jgi:hypothetical protein
MIIVSLLSWMVTAVWGAIVVVPVITEDPPGCTVLVTEGLGVRAAYTWFEPVETVMVDDQLV